MMELDSKHTAAGVQTKQASKSVARSQQTILLQIYTTIFCLEKHHIRVYRGFICKTSRMLTYLQIKNGLSFNAQEHGITTANTSA